MENQSGDNSIIRLFHIHKRYGAKSALNDITMNVERNEFLFIRGPSGAGKTTLLKLMYLGEPPSEGQIIIDGINLGRIKTNRIPFLRRKFGIIFQDFKLIPTKTVFENIALVLEVTGAKSKFVHKKVNSVIRMAGIEDKAAAFPPSLSGGEQQRVAVARAMVGDPKIILADEPTGSLDSESAAIIFNFLNEYHKNGSTVIIATHDKELTHKINGRIIKLKAGRLEGSETIDQ